MRGLALVGLVLVVLANAARAAEDPAGTWKWTSKLGNKSQEPTLKLKLDGDKLTGTIGGRNKKVPIENATYKDGEISFSVARERKGQKLTTKYTGMGRLRATSLLSHDLALSSIQRRGQGGSHDDGLRGSSLR